VVTGTEAIRQGSPRSYELTGDELSQVVASLALAAYCWQQEQRPEDSL